MALFLLNAGLKENTAIRTVNLLIGSKFFIVLLLIFALMIILPLPAAAANVTKVEIRGVVFDEKSSVYNTTLAWDTQNFTGFWYNFAGGKSSETLTINQSASNLTNSSRVIGSENLTYNTSRTDQTYTVFKEKNKKVENGLEYNSTTKTFTNNLTGGYYARLGWFGDLYVAVNGKANKLTKLVKEQKKDEKKTLTIGETWDLGEGFSLTAVAIDAKVSPRQAHLTFSKDGNKLDDKVITEGQVYTYVQKNLAGENDVPIFVTYAESDFAGAINDMVQLRYTWLISPNVTEIKTGDKFGSLEVMDANENYVLLHNTEPMNLVQNAVIDLAGGIKFKVADSGTTLRFYPSVEKTLPGKYEIRGGIYEQSKYTNLIWDAQRFPGFWYNFAGGKSSETLTINQSASNLTNSSRVIESENLTYNTSRSDQTYTVFKEKNKKVTNGLEYNSTTRTFTRGTEGSYYARLGWFGDLYVAMNGKANKLTKLVKEQKKDEKKTLAVGETWDLGEGFSLTAVAIDAKISPRQAHLVLSKDGNKRDDKVATEGQVYTYIQGLVGEPDVPVFVTYVESIFAGATSDMVQLRYTWLISPNVTEIKTGDKFGSLEIKDANENYVLLHNTIPVNLAQNAVIDLAGGIKFKVADSSTVLRFYPYLENTIQATTQVEVKTSNNSAVTPATTTGAATPEATENATAPAPTFTLAGTTAAQTASPVETPRDTPRSKLSGFETLYVIAGFVAAALLVQRKRE